MSDLELFSAPLCPFAHRIRLALAEKDIGYRLIDVDLRNKAPDFLTLSPHGKIPVLRHGDQCVWESAIINEYLEETFPEPPLLPRSQRERALARMWIHFADARLYAVTASLLYGAHHDDRAPAREQLTALPRFMEDEGLAQRAADGPYWFGAEPSLVDLAFYPWFEQRVVLERFRDFRMPPRLVRVSEWCEAVARRARTLAIAKPAEFYLEEYGRHESVTG